MWCYSGKSKECILKSSVPFPVVFFLSLPLFFCGGLHLTHFIVFIYTQCYQVCIFPFFVDTLHFEIYLLWKMWLTLSWSLILCIFFLLRVNTKCKTLFTMFVMGCDKGNFREKLDRRDRLDLHNYVMIYSLLYFDFVVFT